MSWQRLRDGRLTWRSLPIISGGVVALMLLAFLIPSRTVGNIWVGLVAFFGFGLMAKMGENETRHRIATGSRLRWGTSPSSLAFPWWAAWLAASGVLAAAFATFVAANGFWAAAVYVIGLVLIAYVRRRVIRGKRAG